MILALMAACAESLSLPADPAAPAAPVGVMTFEVGALTVEAWYPAEDGVEGSEIVDPTAWVPEVVTARLGALDVPSLEVAAARDAAPRRLRDPQPAVVFSHGLGGFRTQSATLTAHLASRGYVVLATDHVGRRASDLLPCVFSPPLEGCQIANFDDDPGVPDVTALRSWLEAVPEDHPLAGLVDPDRVALIGHSAGGGTTGTAGEIDARWHALLPMAYGPPVNRDVPTLTLAGACDAVVPLPDIQAGLAQGNQPALITLDASGHHAFSDICHFELGALARDVLASRDDVNATFVAGLETLAADGCPGTTPLPELEGCEADAFAARDDEDDAVRALATAFLDDALRGPGGSLDALSLPGVTRR